MGLRDTAGCPAKEGRPLRGVSILLTALVAAFTAVPGAALVATQPVAGLGGASAGVALPGLRSGPPDGARPDQVSAALDSYSLCDVPLTRCTWERTFGGVLDDKAYAVAAVEDDRLVVVGTTRSSGGLRDDALVLSLDRSGQVLWQRSYGGRDTDQLYGVAAAPQAGVLVAGHTRSRGAGKSDLWLLRLNGEGEVLWERTVGESGEDRARTVAALDDGGFVAAGFTRSGDKGDGDAIVVRLDDRGEVAWSRTYGGPRDDGIFNLSAAPDGGLLAVGYKDMGEPAGYDLWVLRLNGEGEVLWERTYGRSVFDAASAVSVTADGGAVVVGVTSEDGFRKDDAWVLRLDREGDLLWERTFGGAKPETAWGVAVTPDDGAIVTVATASYGAGSTDAWMIGLGPQGELLWEKLYGGKLWDRPTALTRLPAGELLVAGYTTTKGAGQEDYWLLRLDSQGKL